MRVECLQNGVKKLILARQDLCNALHPALIAEIRAALKQLAAIEEPEKMRLLVLEGEGKFFSAGADLGSMKDQAKKSLQENKADARQLGKMFFDIAAFPCPVLSVVQGGAIGGGLGLVACSDFTLAAQDAFFATSEVTLGIVPGVISPYIIRKIGVGAASFLFTGEKLSAAQCLSFSLISGVVQREHLPHELSLFIQKSLKAGPVAVRKTKELIRRASPLPKKSHEEFCATHIAQARCSQEGQRGLKAFFERKQPYWCDGTTK